MKWITCTKEHPVDQDDDGTKRSVTVGMIGKATRQKDVKETHGCAWIVGWENGSWGFYSTEELKAVGEMK